MTDISDRNTRHQIAAHINTQIDAYAVRVYDSGHRDHLGASIIGRECSREIWSIFRWLKVDVKTGRQLRLFQRGHLEELRFIEYLRGIGFTVNDRDDNGKQIRISDIHGHFGGSLDGICSFPNDWRIEGQYLTEYKTKGTGAGFQKLIEKGVALTSPEHWGQMCIYGAHKNIEYALYFSVNKNDDSLHIEFVKLDFGFARDLMRKAESIIKSNRPPSKISESAAFWKCKGCTFNGICHEAAPADLNCRSCLNATAVEDGQWFCGHWKSIIPKDVIKVGCANWVSIV